MAPYKLYYLLFNNVPILGSGIVAVAHAADFLFIISF